MQINTVILEVSQSFPKITAMEFFDVNLRLIPTVNQSSVVIIIYVSGLEARIPVISRIFRSAS